MHSRIFLVVPDTVELWSRHQGCYIASDAFEYLAKDGVFDDSELKEFVAFLAAADLGSARSVIVDTDVASLSINNALPPALWPELLADGPATPIGPVSWDRGSPALCSRAHAFAAKRRVRG